MKIIHPKSIVERAVREDGYSIKISLFKTGML